MVFPIKLGLEESGMAWFVQYLAYAVSKMSRFMVNSGQVHWQASNTQEH